MQSVRRHLSYANVISTICLFVVLGGGAYAAAPAKSVGTAQLKAGAVTGAKIKDGTITGRRWTADARPVPMVPVPTIRADDTRRPPISATSADRATRAQSADKAAFATEADLATNCRSAPRQPRRQLRQQRPGRLHRPDLLRLHPLRLLRRPTS